MLIAQILNSNEALAKFRVEGDTVQLLEGSEDAIITYLTIEDEPERDRRTKEEHLRHYSTTLDNTVALQEGRGLQILSDDLPNTSPTPMF